MINMKNIINKIKLGFINATKFLLGLQSKITPANDKLGHFYWGFIYAYPLDLVFNNDYLTIGVPLLLAVSKEIRDAQKSKEGFKLGNVELLDIVATVIPGILLAIN